MSHYCNNCGEKGHMSYRCKFPINSYGVIAYDNSKDVVKYLLICRKDSLGFIDFVRGKYNSDDVNYIKNLVSEMTESEKFSLLNDDFDNIWKKLWNIQDSSFENKKYTKEKEISREKLKKINIKKIINECQQKWKEPEWGFPKGRKNLSEKNLEAAIREFEEETGYKESNIDLIENLLPFHEIFIGSNYKSYKNTYYLAKFKNPEQKSNNNKFQKSEVSNMNWFTFDEAIQKIRPYNLEKLELLRTINTIINKYNI